MKTKAQDLVIALVIFDIIYLNIAGLMMPISSFPFLPNINIIFSYNYLYSLASSYLGVAPSINILGAVIGLGWLYSIIAYLLLPFALFFTFLGFIFDLIGYIYILMTIPLAILPYGLKDIFVLLFSMPIIISIIMGVRIFYSGID